MPPPPLMQQLQVVLDRSSHDPPPAPGASRSSFTQMTKGSRIRRTLGLGPLLRVPLAVQGLLHLVLTDVAKCNSLMPVHGCEVTNRTTSPLPPPAWLHSRWWRVPSVGGPSLPHSVDLDGLQDEVCGHVLVVAVEKLCSNDPTGLFWGDCRRIAGLLACPAAGKEKHQPCWSFLSLHVVNFSFLLNLKASHFGTDYSPRSPWDDFQKNVYKYNVRTICPYLQWRPKLFAEISVNFYIWSPYGQRRKQKLKQIFFPPILHCGLALKEEVKGASFRFLWEIRSSRWRNPWGLGIGNQNVGKNLRRKILHTFN